MVPVRRFVSVLAATLVGLLALAGFASQVDITPKMTLVAAAAPSVEVQVDVQARVEQVRMSTDRASRSNAPPPVAIVPMGAADPPPVSRAAAPAPSKVPAASGRAGVIVRYVKAQVGKRYRWATSGPNTFDCSGLVVAAYRQIGISLPHFTGALQNRGRAVSRANLQPGDLIFPSGGHVGVYVGGGMIVHASNPRSGVKLSTIYKFYKARRIL